MPCFEEYRDALPLRNNTIKPNLAWGALPYADQAAISVAKVVHYIILPTGLVAHLIPASMCCRVKLQLAIVRNSSAKHTVNAAQIHVQLIPRTGRA
jgi:hypothetical protein